MKHLEIKPLPKPRMTGKSAIYSEAAKRFYSYKDELKLLAGNFEINGASEIIFAMPVPKSWSEKKKNEMVGKPHEQRPDLDNLLKGVWDSLAAEDCHLWHVVATKVWAHKGSIYIRNLGEGYCACETK